MSLPANLTSGTTLVSLVLKRIYCILEENKALLYALKPFFLLLIELRQQKYLNFKTNLREITLFL
jgi:hypothetical protein